MQGVAVTVFRAGIQVDSQPAQWSSSQGERFRFLRPGCGEEKMSCPGAPRNTGSSSKRGVRRNPINGPEYGSS
jgi:hypothetical protein